MRCFSIQRVFSVPEQIEQMEAKYNFCFLDTELYDICVLLFDFVSQKHCDHKSICSFLLLVHKHALHTMQHN